MPAASVADKLDDDIYAVLADALLGGLLAPGAQLRETHLAGVFGVTRERVRKVLHRLGHERLLEVIPNRGAFVATPSLEQAREIYEARRILEGGLAARLTGRLTPTQLARLERHVRAERAALKRGARVEAVRLSAAFHLLLGELAASELTQRQLHELVSRTAMLVALFEAPTGCGCDEHEAIVRALRGGDAGEAVGAMHTHLSLIETRLRPTRATESAPAEDVLGRAWQRRLRKRAA